MIRKTLLRILAIMLVAMMLTSCAVLEDFFGEMGLAEIGKALFNKYPTNMLSLDALYRGSADFDDLPLEDRWGLVWNGMFSVFHDSTRSDSMPDMYRLALRYGLGINPTMFSRTEFESLPVKDWETGQVTGHTEAYTAFRYRVEDKRDLQYLAEVALDLLERQGNPELFAQWSEDLYAEIMKTEGLYNSYALMPYLEKLRALVDKVFNEDLSDGSFGAEAAASYAELYPAGYLIDLATERQQVSAGTDAELIF